MLFDCMKLPGLYNWEKNNLGDEYKMAHRTAHETENPTWTQRQSSRGSGWQKQALG